MIVSGGQSVLFASRRNSARGTTFRLETVPFAGGGRRVVLDGGEQLIFASADRLVFRREGALFIAPFDASSVTVTGQASRQNEAVTVTPSGGFAAAVAPVGTLVTAPPSVLEAQMVWVSMNGVERIIRGPARAFLSPRVSPDGRLIAFVEAATIWTLDPERGTFTRVTSHVDPTISFPSWSSDGRRIYYRSSDGIRVQRADGEGASTLLPNTRDSDYPNAATPDGRTLIIQRVAPGTAADIYAMPANGGELTPIVVTNAYEAAAQVSPDGKWLLYVSNESGRMEVYLRPLGGADQKWPVSSEGGLHSFWSRDGKKIYYRSGQQMMVVDFTASSDVHLSAPRVLFEKRFSFGQSITLPNVSLSADGAEFLMVQEMPGGRHLDLVLNWLPSARR